MLHFHLTTTPTSHFSLKNIWMKTFDSEMPLQSLRVREGFRLFLPPLPSWDWLVGQACPVETAQLRKCLAVSRLIMRDIQKVKADATFMQLRIAEVTIIYHVLIFTLYPIIIFLLWQELTYHFPYGQKGVRPSLIIDKAILMATKQQHHLWCWTAAYKPWSLPSHSRWINRSFQ